MIRELDLFPNAQLLRYNGNPDYKTTMGGLISISVITILVILFFNMGIKTATKQLVTATVSSQNEGNPSETKLTMGPQGDMMFAVSFFNFNHSELVKMYDVAIHQ